MDSLPPEPGATEPRGRPAAAPEGGPGATPRGEPSSTPHGEPGSPPQGRAPIAEPYRGLASFSASDEDAALFFGRDRDRELIVANLLASRLTLLYGQSGVGKSSILCAGVVHQLRLPPPSTRAGLRRMVVYVSEWHGDPRARILGAIREEARRLSGREREPSEPDTGLADAIERWSAVLDAQVLLILDQFEQYFLYHPAARDSRFDAELAAAVARTDLRLRCMISLREDTLVELDRFKDEIPHLFENRLRLNPLSEPAALEAIRRPVDRCNELRCADQPEIELERGLAEEVVRQLGHDVAPLSRGQGVLTEPPEQLTDDRQIEPAHVQLVMQALWAREQAAGSARLRIATLAAMGGCAKIVSSHVEGALDGLPPRERRVAARAIRYLVTPSGTKIAYTPTDLSAYAELPRAPVATTLERMSTLRILRPLAPAEGSREGRYEVFHDLLAEPMLDWGMRFETQRLAVRARWLLGWLIAAMTAALMTVAYTLQPPPLRHLELHTIDARFQIRGPARRDREIVIVEVDERSLLALQAERYSSFVPLRPRDGQLIDRLLAGAPRAIAYDLEFSSPGTARYNGPLFRAIERARKRVVLATEIYNEQGAAPLFGETGSDGATTLLRRLGASYGYVDFPSEPGGVYRRMSYAHGPLPSFAVRAAEVAAGHRPPRFSGWALIDYRGPPGSFATVSMIDVLDGRVPPSFFKGKIVVVGVSAPGVGEDLHPTPFSSRARTPDAEVEADAIATVLHGPPIWGVGAGMTLALIVLFSFAPLAAQPFRWWAAAALCAGAGVAYLVFAQLMFGAGVYLPVVYPMLALVIAGAAMLVARGAYAARRGRRGRWRPAGGAPSRTAASAANSSGEPTPRTPDPARAS